MALALFDLDHTLLAGDSDQLWGDYLAERGLVGDDYQARKNGFYADYCAGRLDYPSFARFVLEPLARLPMAELLHLRAGYARDKLKPMLLPKGLARIAEHRAAGDTVLIITATNRFIAEPAAALCGISELLATEPERADGRFTGDYRGEACFQAGKLAHLRHWLARQASFGTRRDASLPGTDEAAFRADLAAASFYSDSHNDLPLLQAVGRPVAVDPDPRLRAEAGARGWAITSFREG